MLTTFLKRVATDTTGATAVEYGLIVSLIVIAMFGALQLVATETTIMWDYVETETTEALGNE